MNRLTRLFAVFLTLSCALLSAQDSDRIYQAINDEMLYDQNGVQVVLNGDIAITPADIDIRSAAWDPNVTNWLELDVNTSIAAALELRATGSASFSKKLSSTGQPFGSFTLGGYTITPVLYVEVEIIGSVTGTCLASTVQQYGIPINLTLGPGGLQSTPGDFEKVFQVDEPVLTQGSGASLEVKVGGGVYFNILTANGIPIGGPYVIIAPSATLAVQPTNNPWWSLDGTAKVVTGWFDFGLNLLPTATLVDETFNIANAGGPLGNLNSLGASRWARTLGESGTDVRGEALALSSNGNLLIAGDGAGTFNRMLYADVAGDGSVNHEQRVDLGDSMNPRCMAPTSDGGSFVGGSELITAGAMVVRYDDTGALQWATRLDTGVDMVESLAATSDGGVVGAGRSEYNGVNQMWVFKLDGSGNVVWSKVYEGPQGASGAYMVRETSTGDLAVAGWVDYDDDPNWTVSTIRGHSAALVLLQSDGTLTSCTLIGTRYAGEANALCETDEGDFILAGKLADQDEAAWIARVDSAGNLAWSRTLAGEAQATGITEPGNSPYDEINDIEPVEGGYVMTGVTGLAASRDAWMIKIDEQGSIVWFKSFRGDGEDVLVDLSVVPGEGLAAIGMTTTFSEANGTSTKQLLLVRTGFDGMLNFDLTNGAQAFDVENDSVAQGDTENVVVVTVTMTEGTVSPTVSSPGLASTDPNLTVTLRSL